MLYPNCIILLITIKFRLMENSNVMLGQKKQTQSLALDLSMWLQYSLERQELSEEINAKKKLDLTATQRCSFRTIRAAARHGVLLHLSVQCAIKPLRTCTFVLALLHQGVFGIPLLPSLRGEVIKDHVAIQMRVDVKSTAQNTQQLLRVWSWFSRNQLSDLGTLQSDTLKSSTERVHETYFCLM